MRMRCKKLLAKLSMWWICLVAFSISLPAFNCVSFLQCTVTQGVISWKSQALQWHQILHPTGAGQLARMSFSKRRSDTYLRLTWSSNFRMIGNGKCAQWYFMINGNRCTLPGSVEGTLSYITTLQGASGSSLTLNSHRHGTITGVCKGTSAGSLGSGSHTVSVWVGQCPLRTDLGVGDVYSGWDSTSHFIVEELCPPQWEFAFVWTIFTFFSLFQSQPNSFGVLLLQFFLQVFLSFVRVVSL